ncbi:hypothetical protein EZV62_003093 [Acer yangbiense]|uniref:RNase H type-1 domain-containing protein n=1 Tax=Acer yangbiense TaxID=1000413 RepID=A0A5C7IGH4_9ROSI|nr:hypothetical protein EZV62_003093 [Acer yangbiense]
MKGETAREYRNSNIEIRREVVSNNIRRGRWIPPEKDDYKANCDAALDQGNGTVGIGMIIRNFEGKVLAAGSIFFEGTYSIKIAKLMAILRCIQFGNDCGLRLKKIESDEATVVKWIKEGSNLDSDYGPLLSEINWLIDKENEAKIDMELRSGFGVIKDSRAAVQSRIQGLFCIICYVDCKDTKGISQNIGTLNTEAPIDNPDPKEVDNMQLLVFEEQSSHRERQYSVEENIPIFVPQLSEEITIPIQIPPVVTSVLREKSVDHFVNDTNSISAHLGSGNSGNPVSMFFLPELGLHVCMLRVLENGGCIAECEVNGTSDETVDVELAIGVDVEGALVS